MLLNRQSLDAAKFASKTENRRVLTALCITPTHVVATDSFHLVEVEHIKQEGELKPDGIRNDSGTGLIPAEAALHASKNIPSPKEDTLFTLKNAFSSVDHEGKRMTLTTTDLIQERSVEAILIEAKYPDYALTFPSGTPAATITVNAKYLKEMAEYFAKHSRDGRMTIEFHDAMSPLVFRGETSAAQKVRGLVMPLRPADAS